MPFNLFLPGSKDQQLFRDFFSRDYLAIIFLVFLRIQKYVDNKYVRKKSGHGKTFNAIKNDYFTYTKTTFFFNDNRMAYHNMLQSPGSTF